MFNGQLFDEKYRIVATLGQGGTSTVYLGQNIRLGTLWAIKQLNKEKNNKMDLLVEPNILKRLNHPALPRVFDIVEDEHNIYIIEDFIEGVSLDKEIAKNGRYPENRVVTWAKQICDVLHYLHSSTPNPIIFRDLKPSNIILTYDDKIKLIDFGIAREYKEECEGDTVCMGTRGYSAPEQFGSFKQTDARADIFSLGITMYNLLSGKRPEELRFDTSPIKEVIEDISNEMEYIIKKCTELDPAKRFQSVLELKSYLNNCRLEDDCNFIDSFDEIKNYQYGNKEHNTCARKKTKETMNDETPETVLLKENDTNISKRIHREILLRNPKPLVFKKLILAILGNAEFSAELAYVIATLTEFNVALINLDFNLDPSIFLQLDKKLRKALSQGDEEVGLAPFLDFSTEYNYISYEVFERAALSRKDLKSLHLITEPPYYENAKRFKDLDVKLLLEGAYKYYDLTLVLINHSPFDEYSVKVSEKADYIIIPFSASVGIINEKLRYMEYMKDKNCISNARYKAVAFEYKRGIHIPENSLNQILPSYIGSIGYKQQREEFRSLGEDFCTFVSKEFSDDYGRILSNFNIALEKKHKKNWFMR